MRRKNIKLLFIDQKFAPMSRGGAFKSNYLIIKKLLENPSVKIKVLVRIGNPYEKQNLTVEIIKPILRAPFKIIKKFLEFIRINHYLSFFQISSQIKKFKPDLIIVQRDLTFPTLIAAFIKKIPVINIIRDAMGLCPKYIDIVNCYKNCLGPINKKKCWKCINYWRSLRILLKDNQSGIKNPIYSQLYSIYYKINFYFTKF